MEFPTTHWTMLAQATLHGDAASGKALEGFILRYREPVMRVIRSRGVAESQVEDLTHDFFLRLMQKSTLRQADPARGRFRGFLGSALKYFLADDMAHNHAQRRGGGIEPLSLDVPDSLSTILPSAENNTALHLDREWALHLMSVVMQRVEAGWTGKGKEERFRVLRCFLPGSQHSMSQDEAGTHLGMSSVALRSEIHRLRQQFIRSLRAEIAVTVSRPEEVDGELDYLRSILSQPDVILPTFENILPQWPTDS